MLVNCLIPDIEKYNNVEEEIIANYLPSFCFKDSALKQQQQEKAEKLMIENAIEVINMNTPPVQNNNQVIATPTSSSTNFLQRKKHRQDSINNKNINKECSVKSSCDSATVGVKLMCDSQNEEIKKYFTKTVI